jgi:hypothetical protein
LAVPSRMLQYAIYACGSEIFEKFQYNEILRLWSIAAIFTSDCWIQYTQSQ